MRAAALLCVMLAPLPVSALSPRAAPTQYRQDWWGRAEGLPHSSVQALAQTPDGYLWVGTGAGLARFDGLRFVVGELDQVDVHALTVTPDGVLWVGTREGELYRYQDGHFRRVGGLRG